MASALLRYNERSQGRTFRSEFQVVVGSDQILFDDMSCTFDYASAIVFSSPLKGPEHVPEKHT